MSDDTPLTGQLLKDTGLIHERADLEINGVIGSPKEYLFEHPWSAPSRLMSCPIEAKVLPDKSLILHVLHPRLLEHPWVQHVNEVIKPHEVIEGDVNVPGTWWHAVDLISEHWELLLETRDFTTNRDIVQATTFALRKRGLFGLVEARRMLEAIEAEPPKDMREAVRLLVEPSEVKPHKGAAYWPINTRNKDHTAVAWTVWYAIEAGWFVYGRNKYLGWSAHGREAYARVMAMIEADEAEDSEAEPEIIETDEAEVAAK